MCMPNMIRIDFFKIVIGLWLDVDIIFAMDYKLNTRTLALNVN